MTLRELYAAIEGDYEQALRILLMEKLIDKYIRPLPDNAIFTGLFEAGKAMDGARLFESAHAIKGVCGNLGLSKLAGLASDLAEEFRPGKERHMTDAEVTAKMAEVEALYATTVDGIRRYEAEAQ